MQATGKRVLGAFANPEFYDHPVERLETVETHISWIVLAGEFAYKLKKPVDFGFLNFSSLRRRRHFCHKEVELNSRLCPELYLGVVPVRDEHGKMVLGGNRGIIVEYAVKMRRLPEDRMLHRLLAEGTVEPHSIDQIASILANFHGHAATGGEVDRYGSGRVIRGNWDENFEQTREFVGSSITGAQFDYLVAWVRASMRRNRNLFRSRVEAGRIRDGHGDLRVSAICVDQQLCIFDCIEFNKRFRYADVAADVAFLAMDLEAKGRPDLAGRFIDEYVSRSGDNGLLNVVDFYVCYRAYVRGKVESFLSVDSGAPEEVRADALATARARFSQAVSAAGRRQPPLLIITCGLSGSGKSAVAEALAAETGMSVVASDVVRKDLAGQASVRHTPVEYETGIYTPDVTRKTYREMLQLAKTGMERGESVLLDATFSNREWRIAARDLAERLGALFLCIECRAGDDVIRERLEARSAAGTSVSDASWGTYVRQRDQFDAVTELDRWQHLIVDTSGDLEATLDSARQALEYRLQPQGIESWSHAQDGSRL